VDAVRSELRADVTGVKNAVEAQRADTTGVKNAV